MGSRQARSAVHAHRRPSANTVHVEDLTAASNHTPACVQNPTPSGSRNFPSWEIQDLFWCISTPVVILELSEPLVLLSHNLTMKSSPRINIIPLCCMRITREKNSTEIF